ncbi:MAG: putative DNA binding domain-containing protein [Deltaproteobacteria bacterium]|jgi:ATP-dependent DNA helicase RecG|nr:putative DNA binding domain-containing protein [Deltaproteobacteria bacterium]
MLRSELLEIIANGENSGVEFKRDDIRPEQLGKEVVALANLHGGRILLGVEDDGSVSGIQRPNLEEWVMDSVFATKVHPMILPFYEEVLMADGKRVAVVSFPLGTTKPYVLRHNNREDIYIRVGSTSRLATREQQARLFASGGILHPETLPVSGTSFASLDLERLKDYLTNVIRDPEVPESEGDWIRRLMGIGFMTEVSGTHTVCTIAGLLLFGIAPRRFLRQAGIRLMVFEGITKEYQALTDEVIDGPLVGRWTADEEGKRALVSHGVIERFAEMIRPFVTREENGIDDKMRRSTLWHYPWEAIREAAINALAHRDWTRFVDVEITGYSDRMELISPGALQNSMTVEKMIAGQRSPRNPLIVEVLRDYGYVDARGMGVRTKIIPLMWQQNKTEPVFEATDDYVKTTLPRGGG